MSISELKAKLEKSLEFLEAELAQIRTGRANTSLLEDLEVEAYGSKMTLKELGSISLLDAHTLIVSPWDKNLLGTVGTAIRESSLNLNPIVGGDSVKVPMPPLSEERRKELVKIVSAKVEEAKNAMRSTRQEAMKDIDNAFEDKEISEDEKFAQREQVEEVMKEYTDRAGEIGDSKKEDLMTV